MAEIIAARQAMLAVLAAQMRKAALAAVEQLDWSALATKAADDATDATVETLAESAAQVTVDAIGEIEITLA